MRSKLQEDQCREGQAVDPQVEHWGGCEVLGLADGFQVGRGAAVPLEGDDDRLSHFPQAQR